MSHFRQQPLFDKHFETIKSDTFTHNYKGVNYTIKKGTESTLDSGLRQSIATRLAKEQKSSKKPKNILQKKSGQNDEKKDVSGENKAPGFTKEEIKKINSKELIRKELLRLSKSQSIIEDRLDYPKVFKKLLSEPHMALYEKKKIVEEKQELYLFVDTSVSYNHKDNGFHHTLIEEAKKIKGIKVFYGSGLRILKNGTEKYYWDLIPLCVPKGKKVLAFSQGCGGTYYGKIPSKDYDLHFVTHFCKDDNCGCSTIREHEISKRFKIHYNIDTPDKLKKLIL